jgi:hypothetical protein
LARRLKAAEQSKNHVFCFAIFTLQTKRSFKCDMVLEHFNIENVEMLRRRVPPPAPQAQAKLASAVAAQQLTDEDSSNVSP